MDRTAIVTGAARGIGLATAKVLGRDHRVVISDLEQEQLDAAVSELRADGVDATAVVCDIVDRVAVDELFARAAQVGRVRAVVHSAGVSPLMGSPEMILRVNALGTIHVTEAAYGVAHEGFAFVNVASMAGHLLPRLLVPTRAFKLALTDPEAGVGKMAAAARRGPRSMRSGSAYSISKKFVIWYSEQQAARFGSRGARILSVSPGSFDTAMGRLEEKSGSAEMLEFAALKRFGRPEEIAELLAFCVSEKPGYLTGTDILCDGGTVAGVDLRAMLSMARRS